MTRKSIRKPTVLRCPICGTLVTGKDEYFPFCTDRCRVVDLGKWASGGYRISSPILDPEVLEGLAENQKSNRDHDD